MNRTITVKGTGHVSLRPDTTVITMTVKTVNKVYEKSMEESTEIITQLKNSLEAIGFSEKDLKTTHFNVYAEYESVQDKYGNYKSVFNGYCCAHNLKIEFGLDTEKLSKTLSSVSSSIAEPELNIQFTVKDKDAAADELLKSAAESALHKAQILSSASGVKLGQLVSVEYNWGELNLYSQTEFMMNSKCLAAPDCAGAAFEPEDIELNDSVTFVWEMCD